MKHPRANHDRSSIRKTGTKYANTKIVLRCYRRLQQSIHPIVASDIRETETSKVRNAMDCLIKLGLAEEVPMVYNLGGGKSHTRKDVRGYKIIA